MSQFHVDLDESEMTKETIDGLLSVNDKLTQENALLNDQLYEWQQGVVWIKEKCISLGVPPFWGTLTKPIKDLTRAELEKRNKEIPWVHTLRAKTTAKLAQPTYEERKEKLEKTVQEMENPILFLAKNMFTAAELEKHGIDPVTFNFKEGYAPVQVTQLPIRPSLWMRIKNIFKSGTKES